MSEYRVAVPFIFVEILIYSVLICLVALHNGVFLSMRFVLLFIEYIPSRFENIEIWACIKCTYFYIHPFD